MVGSIISAYIYLAWAHTDGHFISGRSEHYVEGGQAIRNPANVTGRTLNARSEFVLSDLTRGYGYSDLRLEVR